MLPRPQLSVVIPVLDEDEATIREIIQQAPSDWEIIVVDDGSRRENHLAVVRHPWNVGYGFSLKTGIRNARAPYVATMDGDGQHTLHDVGRLFDFVRYLGLDMGVGDRRLRETSLKRWAGRKALNWTASLLAMRWIPDLNSGIRIFKKKVAMGYEPILCDGFSFTTSLTMSMLCDGYKVDFLPIKVLKRKKGTSKVKLFADGWITLKQIVIIGLALRTRGIRRWLRERR